ncbi:MAG: hypothetical protein Q7T20_02850 [Saprospiraceae bacterium]|nr:hypothetical protein [Saprospiraceae bacterium]
MIHIAISKNHVAIRLTEERWMHITIGHPEMSDYFFEVLETVENPEVVYLGNFGELLAVRGIPKEETKFLVVVYKELEDQSGILIDGFIVTAYSTSRIKSLQKRPILWQP